MQMDQGLRWVIDLASGEIGFAALDELGRPREEWWLERQQAYEMAVRILASHLTLAVQQGDPEVGRLEDPT